MKSLAAEILLLEAIYYNPDYFYGTRKKAGEFLYQLLSGERTFMPYESISMLVEDTSSLVRS